MLKVKVNSVNHHFFHNCRHLPLKTRITRVSSKCSYQYSMVPRRPAAGNSHEMLVPSFSISKFDPDLTINYHFDGARDSRFLGTVIGL